MPFDRSKYPPNWKQISLAAKERAGWACEWCGVKHRAIGYRVDGEFIKVADSIEDTDHTLDNLEIDGHKIITIILTVAHLDHDPKNNVSSNLRAGCQRCHLKYDLELHKNNSAKTRRQKRIDAGQIYFSE
jgi:hypothetical protein